MWEDLGTLYPGLQIKTGSFKVTMAASADGDIGFTTTSTKFPTAMLFHQMWPIFPDESWGCYVRGMSIGNGATYLDGSVHVQNEYGATNHLTFNYVAFGY